MTSVRTEWRQAPDRRDEARALHQSHGLHPVVAHALLNRGVAPEDAGSFLLPDRSLLGDPGLLPDIDRAAERLATAVRESQKVCIYGDFDADGCSAGALLARFLARRGVPHTYYVPDRFSEGYGVNAAAVVQILAKSKPDLLVTVDCGIGSVEELNTAMSLGADVIVTDHHQPPERLPDAPAVNPHRADSEYPFADLCGAAVVYKLCCHTAALLAEDVAEVEADLLELVAIGTIADVMPLVGENRYFAYHGLRALARTASPGLRALFETARIGGDDGLAARDIGFGIGPRLNAAGRLETGLDAYRLLVTEDQAEAWQLARKLERLNRERREIEARIGEQAAEQLRAVSLHETWGLVVSGAGWHEGVIGLVAGRLCRAHARPALAISTSGDGARGSGRSTAALDLHDALGECAELLTEYGGHPRAVGFSLPTENVDKLRARFDEVAHQRMTAADLTPVVCIECRVKAAAVDLQLAKELARLAPFGEGNPEPVLQIEGLRIGEARATRDGTHLQITFLIEGSRKGAAQRRLKGFWPRKGRLSERLPSGREVTVAACLQVDTWQGREQPQLIVEDLRVGSS